MEGKSDSGLLGDRDDLPHEVGEVVPDLLFRVLSPVCDWPLFELVHLDAARRRTSTASTRLGTPYSRLFPRERGDMDPGGRQVPQELLKGLDPLVSLRQGEYDLVALAEVHISHVVEYQSGIVHFLAQFRERGDVHLVVGNPRVYAFGTQLLDEQQFVGAGAWVRY